MRCFYPRGWPFRNPPGTSFTLNRDSPQARGLGGWWPALGSRGANTLRDLAGRGNNGSFGGGTASPAWVSDGEYGFVLDYDGSDDIVTGTSPMSGLAAAAFVLWVYQKSSGGSIYGSWMASNTAYNAGFYIGRDSPDDPGSPGMQWYVGTKKVTVPSANFAFDVWHCVVCAYAGSVHMTIYVDGVQRVQNTTSIPASIPAHTGFEMGRQTTNNLSAACRLGSIACYSLTLSPAEAWAIYDPATRWDLYQPVAPPRFWSVPAAGGAISGSSAGSATASGALTGSGALAGASAGVATGSAALTGTGALSGTATGVATASAGVSGSGALAGSADGAATVSGQATGAGELAGSADGVATVSGAMAGAGALEGAANGTATPLGILTGDGVLVGAANGVVTVSGTLSSGGDISGSSDGSATVSGVLTGAGALAGAATGSGDATATLSGAFYLEGTAGGLASTSGVLLGSGALAGVSAGIATLAGMVNGAGALAGSAAGIATASLAYSAVTGLVALTLDARGRGLTVLAREMALTLATRRISLTMKDR